jgi:opacity protein-like surface antigen
VELRMQRKNLTGENEKPVIQTIKKILILSFVCSATAVFAQVAPSVKGGEATLWGGVEYSHFTPDYGALDLNGIGALVDINLTSKIGAIGEARWLHWSPAEDGGETQSDYLAGVKYRAVKIGRLSLNAKFLVGGVWINYPRDIGTGSYFAYAPGGFADFRLTRRLKLRGDYEYQILPSAPGIPGQPDNGLEPHGFSVGVLYNILR